MVNRFKNIIFLFLATGVFNSFSQNNTLDSLRNLLKKPDINDTALVKLYSLIGEQIYQEQPDSAVIMWQKTIDVAEKKLKSNHTEAEKKVFFREISASYNNIGFIEQMRGKPHLALYYFKKSLPLSEKLKDNRSIAIAFNNIGYNLVRLGNTAGALEYYNKSLLVNIKYGTKQEIIASLLVMGDQYGQMKDYKNAVAYLEKALKIAKEARLREEEASLSNQIGIVYQKANDFEKSLTHYFECLEIYESVNNLNGISMCYNNLGAVFFATGKYDDALNNFRKSLSIRQTSNWTFETHTTLVNIGMSFMKLNKKDSCLKYLNKSLSLSEKIGNKQLAFSSLSHLSDSYFNFGDLKNAEVYGIKALTTAKATGYPEFIKTAADLMQKIYMKKGNYKEALNMYQLFVEMKDSLSNIETQKAGINSRLKYEYDLKTVADSVKIGEERKLTDTKLKQEKVQRYALFGGIFVIAVFAGFMYNRFKKTQKQKVIIELKEKETQQQKELLQEKNKEILDSINYAKRLQEAILPSKKIWESALPNSFIYYVPKDIVAGDFYWIEKIGDRVWFAAADCTGHGVPGALVSVVCSNALNRVVKEFGIYEPNEILGKVRELVIETFEKSEKEVNDGMDISLCCLNTNTNILHWAGANNPLWLVRDNILTEIKADKQPIGKHMISKPFTNHEIKLHAGDSIYIFTDGLPDQFGGPKARLNGSFGQGKKFKYKQLEKILLETSHLEPLKQKEIIHASFIEWKNSLEQVDDVCVIGLRV